MSNPNFVPMNQEQREQVKLKRLADQQYASEHLYPEYKDEQFWREQSIFFGTRLPMWWKPASDTKYVRRACKKLGIDIKDFVDSTGFSNINQFVQNNPRWSALAVVGLCIEYKLGLECEEK